MKRKNIRLKVIQNDLLEKKRQLIFEGLAKLDHLDSLKIYYQESDKTKVRLTISEREGFLLRKGEALVQMRFNLDKLEQAKVSTSVGDIYMEVNTLNISLENNNLFLYYELSDSEATVGKFQLEMEWEDE
ncbi:MAG: DUF1934 domain-containing protein [Erysipelothrix sp.]|nr:DUF1934 domain-containing protein [Erysipelothrix sp.]